MLKRYIRAGRQHARAHKFVGRVGLLAPQDHGQALKAQFQKLAEHAGMIRIERKTTIEGAGGIADINANNAAGR